MTELAREFGDLLTQGLKSIAARESKALLALEDELGYERVSAQGSKKLASLSRLLVQRRGIIRAQLSKGGIQ